MGDFDYLKFDEALSRAEARSLVTPSEAEPSEAEPSEAEPEEMPYPMTKTEEWEKLLMNSKIQKILENPVAAGWLVEAAKAALEDEPFTAMNRAEMLAQAMRERFMDWARAQANG